MPFGSEKQNSSANQLTASSECAKRPILNSIVTHIATANPILTSRPNQRRMGIASMLCTRYPPWPVSNTTYTRPLVAEKEPQGSLRRPVESQTRFHERSAQQGASCHSPIDIGLLTCLQELREKYNVCNLQPSFAIRHSNHSPGPLDADSQRRRGAGGSRNTQGPRGQGLVRLPVKM